MRVRLFVGIDLPDALGAELVRAGPRTARGIRVVLQQDLHITLQFIGSANVDAVQAALAGIRASGFRLEIAVLGQFRMNGGRRILWAGVESSSGLLDLHRLVAEALAGTGFVPETRAYKPHVTLARTGRNVDPALIDRLIESGENKRFGAFDVTDFVLYDTTLPDSPHRYHRLRRYVLSAGASGTGSPH